MNMKEASAKRTLLRIAGTLGEEFTAEELVVAAWKADIHAFGLPGYEVDYPDSNRVLANLMGKRGLVRCGMLSRRGPKRYALTVAGTRSAGQAGDRLPKRQNALSGPLERFLTMVDESKAVALFRQSRRVEITFMDVCRLWGIREDMAPGQVEAVVDDFTFQLGRASQALDAGDVVLPSGRVVTADLGRELQNIHRSLLDRYARLLKLMGMRQKTA